jgi:phosphoglucosamine mutase
LRGLTIVVDAAHGATYRTAPRIFKKLGAQVIMIHNKPNGYNINEACGAVHPESLQQAVIVHGADIGFAFDGDGDRITAVNALGEIKNGDDILALLSEHPAYKQCTTIVGTIMSNCGLEQFLQKQQKNLIRTPVGDKYIAQKLIEEQVMLGGEPSGHIICNDILSTGDGVLAALRVVESMLFNNNPLLTTFTKYPSMLTSIATEHKPDLTQEPYAIIIRDAQQALPHGRIIVRYSGTEPVLRVMVEAATHELVEHHANSLTLQLKNVLQYSNPTHQPKEYYDPQEFV